MSTIREAIAAPWPVRSRDAVRTRTTDVVTHRTSLRGFALIIAGLIIILSGLLMALNIMLVHGAFAVQSMQTESQSLERAQQSLGDAVASEESPSRLAERAAALGMQPAINPIFLKLKSNSSSTSSNGQKSAVLDINSAAVVPH